MVVVTAHLNTTGASEAVQNELHHRRCLANFAAIATVFIELGRCKNARLRRRRKIDNQIVFARIDCNSAEAVRDIGGLDVSTANHLFDDGIASDLRLNLPNLAVGQSVDRLHYGRGIILRENANELAGVDEVNNVRRTINLGRT